MPVLVRWKWNEQTKTFLVIFHFIDDYLKPNLRLKKCDLFLYKARPIHPKGIIDILYQERHKYLGITWAPSHPELAYLTELLTYANIINGLKIEDKLRIRGILEGAKWEVRNWPSDDPAKDFIPINFDRDTYFEDGHYFTSVIETEKGKVFAVAHDIKLLISNVSFMVIEEDEEDVHMCFEVNQRYLDYLKKALKRYLLNKEQNRMNGTKHH